MTKTNLQRNALYYDRIIKEGRKSRQSEKYRAVCTELETLVSIADKLKEFHHQMTEAEYRALAAQYKTVQERCRTYINSEDALNDYEKEHKGIVKEIFSMVTKDIKALDGCDPKKPGTLADVMSKSRSHTVVLKRSDIQEVGGVLSSRIPLKTAGGKRGFFTPKKTYNQDKQWAKQLENNREALSVLPKDCLEQLEELKTNGTVRRQVANICTSMIYDGPEKMNRMTRLARVLGLVNVNWESGIVPTEEKKMFDALYSFASSISLLANQYRVMRSAGIEAGANVSSRNCAMTDVARLLQCDHLLAKSTHMTIKVDGEEMEGVFMESAEGTDLYRLKSDDPVFQADAESFDSPAAMHQIADLQVLDFICGNIDRHSGNLVYQFKKTSGGVMLAGVTGIDNDCSFGTLDTQGDERKMKLVKPEDMKFITAEMKATLEGLEKPMLQAALANDGLSEAEIDAAWERLESVRKEVSLGNIQVVKKDFWYGKDLQGIEAEDNYFSDMKALQANCSAKYYLNTYRQNLNVYSKRKIEYAKEEFSANKVMLSKEKQNQLRNIREKLNGAKARFFNSSEYEMMETRFKAIEGLTLIMNQNYPDGKNIPESLTDNLRDAYVKLAEDTYKYISLKSLVPYQPYGRKRLDAARDLLSLASETLDEVGKEFDVEESLKAGYDEFDDDMDDEMDDFSM